MMVANYHISGGRCMVKNPFGILAICWRCYFGTMEQQPDTADLLMEMAVLLHNFLGICSPSIGNTEVEREDKIMNSCLVHGE